MRNLIFVISLFLFTFVSYCYGEESTITVEDLTLTEILNQAGIAEPNEVILLSDESLVNKALTILLEMLASACTANPDGCNDGSDETVNAIMDMIKQVLSIYNDTTTTTTGESEPSEATAAGAAESSSEITERGTFEIAETGDFGLGYPDFRTEQLTEGGSAKAMSEPLRIPANTVLTGDVVWEGEVILEGWVFLPGAYDPNDPLVPDPNDQLVYDPNEELVSFTIKPGTYIHGDPCVYDIGIWLSPGHNIKWNGLPDNWITFSFVPEVPDWNNWHGIVIEGEPAIFEMNYCDVKCATNGIYQFGTGDLKIQNNRFWGCDTGIVKIGPGKVEIANNAFQEAWYAGIDIFMERALEPNYLSEASNDTEVIITNNTIVGSYYNEMGQSLGIIVHGVSEFEDAGIVEIANNLIVASRTCAIAQVGGYMLCQGRKNNAYGINNLNVNEGNPFPDVNDIELLDDPFEYYYDSGTTFLWQPSEAVDGGLFEVDETPLVYMSTSVDGTTDTGMLDIGYHWTAWDWSNDGLILYADVNEDCVVDSNDLYYLSISWLEDPNVLPDPNDYPGGVLPTDPNLFYLFPNKRADINEDMIVDYVDFALFSRQWLWESVPGIGRIDAEFDQDPCSLSNIVTVTINTYGADPPIEKVIPLIDGLLPDETDYPTGILSADTPFPILYIDTSKYSNGLHELKFIGLRPDAPAVCSSVMPVTFNNVLYNVFANDQFHPDEYYSYRGFYDGNSPLEAKVTDRVSEQVLWSNLYSEKPINIVIPGSAFGTSQLCELSIAESGGGEKSSGGSEVTKKDLTKKFKKQDGIVGRMVIVLPNKDVFKVREDAIIECAKACENRGVSWVSLYKYDVNRENLTYLFTNSSVRYIYWCGHANSHVGADPENEIEGVPRTHTECWEEKNRWWWPTTHSKIGVFSHTLQTIEDTQLPDDWDNRGFDLMSLDMWDQWNKKIVFVDGCLSAKRHETFGEETINDMAEAYGMWSLAGYGSKDQVYIGWRTKVLVSTGFLEKIVGDTTDGISMFWQRMGAGDYVEAALEYTAGHGGAGMRRAMWGINGNTDIGDIDGDDNIFLWGLGLLRPGDVKLN